MLKPTIDGAISSITKGINQLERVIQRAGAISAEARNVIAAEEARMRTAQEESARAARIKQKLEELVS